MIFGMKTIALYLVGAFLWVSSGTALAALTTEELTRLKMSGLGEEVIRFMVENGYDNVDRVVKLKEAGFADETISSVIKTDLKAVGEAKLPAPQPVKAQQAQPVAEAAATMQTLAKVRIEQYLAVGEPVVKNSQDISNATISLLQGRRLKIEWDGNPAVSTLDNILRRKPFENPFYWDLDKGDALHSVNPKDNSFILRTGRLHQGRPAADRAHYWIVHVTPNSPDLEKRIRELLSE
jgi:hypothetical protein